MKRIGSVLGMLSLKLIFWSNSCIPYNFLKWIWPSGRTRVVLGVLRKVYTCAVLGSNSSSYWWKGTKIEFRDFKCKTIKCFNRFSKCNQILIIASQSLKSAWKSPSFLPCWQWKWWLEIGCHFRVQYLAGRMYYEEASLFCFVFINLFIFGCIGSSVLCAGFL